MYALVGSVFLNIRLFSSKPTELTPTDTDSTVAIDFNTMRTLILLLAMAVAAIAVSSEPCADSLEGCTPDEDPSALMLVQTRMQIAEERKASVSVDLSEEHKIFFEGLKEKRTFFEQVIKSDTNLSPEAVAAFLEFEGFLAANDRDYHTVSLSAIPEYIKRLETFAVTKKMINARNAAEMATNTHPNRAQHGITKYADWTPEEFKALLGHKGRQYAAAKGKPSKRVQLASGVNTSLLESSVMCTKNYASRTSMRNQGSCGSCWTFATATTVRAAYIQQHGVDPGILSTQFIVDCMITGTHCKDGVNGCCGGDAGAAMEWIAKQGGIPTQAAYGDIYSSLLQTDMNGSQRQEGPVSHSGRGITYSGNNPTTVYPCKTGIPKAVSFAAGSAPRHMGSESEMASWVCGTGVLAVAVDAGAWQTYTGGVMQATSCGTSLDHAVTLIGMNAAENSWIIQNSWGTDWGVNLDGTTPLKDKYSNCPSLAASPGCSGMLMGGATVSNACALSCSGTTAAAGYIFLQYGQNTCGVAGEPIAATGTVAAGSSSPTPTNPPPATPAPSSTGTCVTGTGSGGCVMQSSGCGAPVEFTFLCDNYQTYTLTMPDSYSWDMTSDCNSCSNIAVQSV